jgi:hypothetical protein
MHPWSVKIGLILPSAIINFDSSHAQIDSIRELLSIGRAGTIRLYLQISSTYIYSRWPLFIGNKQHMVLFTILKLTFLEVEQVLFENKQNMLMRTFTVQLLLWGGGVCGDKNLDPIFVRSNMALVYTYLICGKQRQKIRRILVWKMHQYVGGIVPPV